MWNFLIGIVLVIIIIMSINNISSLIRKAETNPNNWTDLLLGILVWGIVIFLLLIQLVKHIN